MDTIKFSFGKELSRTTNYNSKSSMVQAKNNITAQAIVLTEIEVSFSW